MARIKFKHMDMAPVIAPFSERLTVYVLEYKEDDEGVVRDYIKSKFNVVGSLQPIANKLEQVEYGNYYKQQWKFYTLTIIPVDIQDDIKIKDKFYRVTNKKDWSRYGYFMYTLDERYAKKA